MAPADRRAGHITGGDRVLELDPEIWKHLPIELLDRAICRLPFTSLVAFRAVSKDWCSDVVPRAAQHIQASGLSNRLPVLLYFDHRFVKKAQSFSWWLQLCDEFASLRKTRKKFQPASFPRPSEDEYVRLLASEGGLLFFGFIDKQNEMIQDFVVCNPLTGKSKRLGLPCPLLFRSRELWDCNTILVGVALDVEMGGYQLVAAGGDGFEGYPTLVYDSSTGLWSTYPTLLQKAIAAVGAEAEEFEEMLAEVKKGIYFNGSLYWYASLNSIQDYEVLPAILKFDMTTHVWTMMELPQDVGCCEKDVNRVQMASYQGKLLLWHIHEEASSHRRTECPPDCIDDNCAAWYCNAWTAEQRSPLERQLHPDLKLMSQDMMAEVEEILDLNQSKLSHPRSTRSSYLGLSQGNVFYHIMELFSARSEGTFLSIATHNHNHNGMSSLDSEFALMSQKGRSLRANQVWLFLASLTSVP